MAAAKFWLAYQMLHTTGWPLIKASCRCMLDARLPRHEYMHIAVRLLCHGAMHACEYQLVAPMQPSEWVIMTAGIATKHDPGAAVMGEVHRGACTDAYAIAQTLFGDGDEALASYHGGDTQQHGTVG